MKQKTWRDCAEFHGHECGGLTIGYKAALYAIKLLDIGRAEDEEIVCISENDACGVDAIQVMLGCTAGKGNLLFHLAGKPPTQKNRARPCGAHKQNWLHTHPLPAKLCYAGQ